MANQKIIQGDCLEVMTSMDDSSIDVTVTSPPYNLGKKYNEYDDSSPRHVYLRWLTDVFEQIHRIIKSDGSFFLNFGFISRDQWIAMDVANIARQFFTLQNHIVWIKSISINKDTYGHFQPINSKRYLHSGWEHIFHFTKTGNTELDRLAIGVPFVDKNNISRWNRNKSDLRCRGNTWYIKYKTLNPNRRKSFHPTTFPVELPERCIKLHGVQEGLMVLDPFVGIGSTLLACDKLNVNGIGIEIDEEYCKMAMEITQK